MVEMFLVSRAWIIEETRAFACGTVLIEWAMVVCDFDGRR
jgi:hypothetical protein